MQKKLAVFRVQDGLFVYEYWYSSRCFYRRFICDRLPQNGKDARPIRISADEYFQTLCRALNRKGVALLDNGDITSSNV